MPTNILRFDGNLALNGHVVEGVMPAPAGAAYAPVTNDLALTTEGGPKLQPAVNTASFLRRTHRGVQGFAVEQATTNLVDTTQGAGGLNPTGATWGRQTRAVGEVLTKQHTPSGSRTVGHVRWYDNRAAGTNLGGITVFQWSPTGAGAFLPVTPGATYTASFFMRMSGSADQLHVNTIYVREYDSASTQQAEGGGTYGVTPLEDGWARYTRTFTVGANTTKIIVQTYNYAPDGEMWAYDPQVEQTAFATSYVSGTRPRGELRYDNLGLGAQGTLSLWVMARQIITGTQQFFNAGRADGTATNMVGLTHVTGSSLMHFVYRTTGADVTISAGTTASWLNTWRHVAVTWSGTALRFYLDGALHWEGSAATFDIQRLYFGGWIGDMAGTTAQVPNARYAHLISAPTALAAGDIAQLYKQQKDGQLIVQDNRLYAPYRYLEGEMPLPSGFTQGAFRASTDLIGDRFVQATTAAVTYGVGVWGGAVYMGANERLEYPLFGSDSGTVMWLHRPDNAATTTEVLMDAYDVPGNRRWYVERTPAGRLRLWVSGPGLYDSTVDISAPATWYHLAFTWTPTGTALYVNGAAVGTRSGDPVGLRDFQRVLLRYTNTAALHPYAWYASLMHARRALSASEVADIARLALTGDFSVKDGTIHVRQSITEGAF